MSALPHWLNAQNNTLIYVGDPMCSWCYGFAPEITELKENHPELDFKLIVGGLRPYGDEKIVGMGKFLKHHWDEINKRTGQPFKYDILKDPDFIYDTEPPCRAVVVVRHLAPEKELTYFKAVQTAFYEHNENTNKVETYVKLAKDMGLDAERFEELYNSDEIKEETKQDFGISNQMGVTGFPAVILKKGDEYFKITAGWQKADKIEKVLSGELKE